MNRRQLIATVGVIGAGGLAGCLGDDGTDAASTTDDYETKSFDGVSVPLVPTADVLDWHDAGEVRFVDTRSATEFEDRHIEAAVLSPAPDGLETDDPVAAWPTDARIVTYCVCPHALSGLRASSLLDAGYEEVYALDEGLQDWIDAGGPTNGEEATASLPSYTVRGQSDPAHAGDDVWVRHRPTAQREPGTIAADGRYTVTFHFSELHDETVLELETPATTVEKPLAELTDGLITV